MGMQTIAMLAAVIDYIENHLDERLDLETVAARACYSKYHLHRLFTDATGMTLHDYVQRRRLTEAAKLLCFSERPILDIALRCGYESQQSFSAAFKAMYKWSPAAYRTAGTFYPLQLRLALQPLAKQKAFTLQDVALATPADIPEWMALMRLVIDGYPVMDELAHQRALTRSIAESRALLLRDDGLLVGALAFSRAPACIDFWGVHPQYRARGLQRLFLQALLTVYLPGQVISTTTYRQADRADTGHREMLLALGFAERELLTEFGYPTQRFVHLPLAEGDADD